MALIKLNSNSFSNWTTAIPDDSVTTAKIADDSIQSLKNRNLIINGAMNVAQRRTGRSFGGTYNSLDRWATGQYQEAGHEQVSVTDTSVPTKKAVRVTSSSTSEAALGTRMALAQIVESQNCDFLAGKKVTLSFYIRFSDATMSGGGNFRFELSEYDSVDPNLQTTGATRINGTNIAQGSLPTSWTKYTKTITCASTMKNLGARFLFEDLFNTTANSDEWYEVTAVQLEVGDVATPFEHESFGDTLAKCQRYYQKAVFGADFEGAYSTYYAGAYALPVSMRATPTLSNVVYALSSNINTSIGVNGIYILLSSQDYIGWQTTAASASRAYGWSYGDLDAEL